MFYLYEFHSAVRQKNSMLHQGSVLKSYEIQSVIGRGGFGIVYKGRHQELGIDVAIKEYFPQELSVRKDGRILPSKPEFQASFEDGLTRFLREAQQLEKFRDCPNIVTCRDLFRANGTAYTVMEYVSGLPLSVLLEKRESNGEPLTEQELLELILPLLRGLQTVHESGVCHRDIKPSNILVRRVDAVPILIDFGAAKHEISRHTKSFAPYTDGYAALEQVGEGEIGSWTDMYGLGAVMWRIVAGGNPPFLPPTPLSSPKRAFELMNGRVDPLPTAKQVGKNRFSKIILQTIDDCLALDVSKRIQNCQKLTEKLKTGTTGKSKVIIPRGRNEGTVSKYENIKQKHLAAEGGEVSAQYEMGKMYDKGQGMPKSEEDAVKWYRLAGIQGHVEAQYRLGEIYEDSSRLWDEQEAYAWWNLASAQGHKLATKRRDKLSQEMDSEDVTEAQRRSLRLSKSTEENIKQKHLVAEGGEVSAQYEMGKMYDKGQGVPKSEEDAVKWYRLAGIRGHVEAQYRLGEIYEDSSRLWDEQEAYAWWNLASAQGHELATKRRDELSQMMVSEDVTKAQRRSLRLSKSTGEDEKIDWTKWDEGREVEHSVENHTMGRWLGGSTGFFIVLSLWDRVADEWTLITVGIFLLFLWLYDDWKALWQGLGIGVGVGVGVALFAIFLFG